MSQALYDWSSLDSAALKSTEQPVTAFRTALATIRETFKQQFFAGESAAVLVQQRANAIDNILIKVWHHLVEPHSVAHFSLVAVGGYGRGELLPASDVDLLVLLDDQCTPEDTQPIERFLVFLWDIGLEVGQSVRTIAECSAQASRDITVATNLMEARLIAGPVDLFEEMLIQVRPDHIWPSREFFMAKLAEQNARHKRFHDTAYNLEPNVKESPGGLRDLQMIGWVAKRHFGATTLEDLVHHQFLTEAEYTDIVQYQNFLWRVRIGLHILTSRREDRLLFDHQRRLAEIFGYRDEGHRLAVEHFMKDYYRTVMNLSRLNEMLLQLFAEEILSAGHLDKPVAINRRFQARGGFIEVTHPNIFKRYPFALLEIFLLLAQHHELQGVRANTIRLIRDHRYLINDKFRNDLRCKSLFMDLFRQPHGLTHELHRLNRYGILAEYLPVFGDIVGQMQHDLFHVYTVDEHTLIMIRNLRRFTVPKHHHEFPLCSQIIQRIPKPELLYFAALFHDIAKGRGGDHSELGALEALDFCQKHGLSSYDAHTVSWLVRHHLVMSTTAQRKDISDPAVIQNFAALVGTQHRLNYLYLLTVADIRATNSSLWNSWKDALLAELYQVTTRALRRGLENPLDISELADETRTQALLQLQAYHPNTATVHALWDELESDYFTRHSVDEVIWQTLAIVSAAEQDLPLVLFRSETLRGGSELFVYAKDHRRLFAVITTALERTGLNITDARIITSKNGYALDTFIVLDANDEPVTSQERADEIQRMVRAALVKPASEDQLAFSAMLPMARQLKHFPIPTDVSFRADLSNQRTIMEVVARDRPGLLAMIARAMLHCGVRLQSAKIATFGERVEDIFFITDELHQPLQSDAQFDCLRESIHSRLEQAAAH